MKAYMGGSVRPSVRNCWIDFN